MSGILLLALGGAAGFSTAEHAAARKVLEQSGVEANLKGVGQFLLSLNPDNEVNQPIHELVAQLEAATPEQRETATKALLELRICPELILADATASPDAEVRERANQVLRRSKGKPQWQVCNAVLQIIRDEPIKGAASYVLDARQWIDHEPTRAMFADVIAATAVAEDASRLRELYHQANAAEKEILVRGMIAAIAAQSVGKLRPLITDSDIRIRLAAARALVGQGDRGGLPVLAELLTSENSTIRAEAISILQAVTGQHLGFVPHEARAETAHRWSEWLKQHGNTCELKLPLRLGQAVQGLISVCVPEESRVLVLNVEGKLVEELKGASAAKDCERQPTGNWLVASYQGRHLAEYDRSGKKLWEWSGAKLHDLKGPLRIRRLEGGNLLVTFLDSMTVAELNAEGKIVWQLKDNGWPVDAERLENGNTLVTMKDSGIIAEYDRRNQVIWQLSGLKSEKPSAAQRLPNGNTLVPLVKGNRVQEFDATGQPIWSCGGFQQPEGALRLADGTTVIAESTGIRRVDRDGAMLWHYPIANTDGLRVY